MIKVNATKKYKDIYALSDVRFEVDSGSVIYLLGESGSGKSTLLKIIAGLVDNSNGQVVVGGATIEGPEVKLVPGYDHIAYVPQDYKLQQFWTVRDNVGKKISHYLQDEREARVLELLRLCGLENKINSLPSELSGGQQQRVAIASAIADEPDVVLLDEPFSNLDLPMKMEVRQEVIGMLRELGITVVLVSHDPSEAMAVADQIIVLEDGKLVQQGTPLDLYHNPLSSYVGSLLGPVNEIKIKDEMKLIRPERIRIDDKGALEGTVKMCSFAGMHYHLNVALKGHKNEILVYWSEPIALNKKIKLIVS